VPPVFNWPLYKNWSQPFFESQFDLRVSLGLSEEYEKYFESKDVSAIFPRRVMLDTTSNELVLFRKYVESFNLNVPETVWRVPELTVEKSYEETSKYWIRKNTEIDGEILTAAKELMRIHLRTTYSGCGIMNSQEVKQSMVKGTSPGWGYRNWYHTKGESMECPLFDVGFGLFYDSLLTENPMPDPFMSTLKWELRPVGKNPRTFMTGGLHMHIVMAMHWKSQMDAMVKNHKNIWSAVGVSQMHGGWDELYYQLTQMGGKKPLFISADVSGWDRDLCPELMEAVREVTFGFWPKSQQTPDNLKRNIMLERMNIFGPVVLEGGEVVDKIKGMPSGTFITIKQNTEAHLLLDIYAFIQMMGDDWKKFTPIQLYGFLFTAIWMKLVGDDEAGAINTEKYTYFSVEKYKKAFADFGMILKKCDVSDKLESLEFLSCSWVQREGVWVAMPNRTKVLCQMTYGCKTLNPKKIMLRGLSLQQGCWADRELYQVLKHWNRKYHDDYRSQLMTPEEGQMSYTEIMACWLTDDEIAKLHLGGLQSKMNDEFEELVTFGTSLMYDAEQEHIFTLTRRVKELQSHKSTEDQSYLQQDKFRIIQNSFGNTITVREEINFEMSGKFPKNDVRHKAHKKDKKVKKAFRMGERAGVKARANVKKQFKSFKSRPKMRGNSGFKHISAPIASGFKRGGVERTNKKCTVPFREDIGDLNIPTSSGFTVAYQKSIQPGLPPESVPVLPTVNDGFGVWLSRNAQNWKRYRPKWIVVKYKHACPSTTRGEVGISYQIDSKAPLFVDKREAVNVGKKFCSYGSAWTDLELKIPLKYERDTKDKLVRQTTPVGEYVEGKSAATSYDISLYDMGTVQIWTAGVDVSISGQLLGDLTVEGVFDFMDQQTLPTGVGENTEPNPEADDYALGGNNTSASGVSSISPISILGSTAFPMTSSLKTGSSGFTSIGGSALSLTGNVLKFLKNGFYAIAGGMRFKEDGTHQNSLDTSHNDTNFLSVTAGAGITILPDFYGEAADQRGFLRADNLTQTGTVNNVSGVNIEDIVQITDYTNAEWQAHHNKFWDVDSTGTVQQIGYLSVWEIPNAYTIEYKKRKALKEKKDAKELDTLLPRLKLLLEKEREQPIRTMDDYFSKYVMDMKNFSVNECKKESDIPRPQPNDQMGRALYEGMCVEYAKLKASNSRSGSGSAASAVTPLGLNALQK